MSKQGNKLTPLAPISSLRTPRAVPNSPISSRNPEARALQCWEPWWAEPLPRDPCQPPVPTAPVGQGELQSQRDTALPGLRRAPAPRIPLSSGHPTRRALAWVKEPLRNPDGKYPQTATAPPAL